MKTTRLLIHVKDVQRITGRGERHARNLIRKIKRKYGKEYHQFLTIDEFCAYVGLKREELEGVIEV